MGQVRQDNVQIKLKIDGSQSKTELDNLTRRAQVLTTGLKEMKRGTDEYIAANKELRQVNARMGELRQEIGITGLSIAQLGTLSKQLARELVGLTPGTESFINKSKELVEVDNRLALVRRQAKGVQEELGNAGGGIGDFLKKAVGFAGIQLGVQAVVSGLKELGASSIAEFEQAAGAAAQLEASLTSTGNAAGLTKQELLDISTALEGKTIFDGDAITQAQSVLLTFTKIKKGVYEEAVPAITDMATKLAGDGEADLKGATIQVGKALNDPVKGITALAKAGVSFSDDQKKMIKSLVDTGDVAAAQTIILQELKNEFGGSAEAAAKAGTGPLKQFEVQIGNVKEGLGELILDGLQALQPALTVGLKLLSFLLEALKATPAFLSENRVAFGLLGAAVLAFNGAQIVTQLSTIRTLALQKLHALGLLELEGETYSLVTAQEALDAALLANPIGIIIGLLALFAFGLKQLYDRSETFRAAVDSLFVMLKPLGDIFSTIAEQAGKLFTSFGKLFGAIGGGKVILEIFGALMSTAVVVPLKLVVAQVQATIDVLAAFLDMGKNVANLFGADFQVDPNGSFEAFTKHLAENAKSIGKTLVGADEAEQAIFSMIPVYQGVLNQQQAFFDQAKVQEKQAAVVSAAASLEALKAREANIKAALALVAAGSAEELRLKKLEIVTKRDIDLLGEKNTEGDKKVIRAEALRDLRQLQDDYDRKSKDAAEKLAKEQADVAKRIADLKAGLLADETQRRVQQLIAAADKEKATAKGTAEQIAEQRRLILDKLAVDVAEVERAQAQKQALEALDIEKSRNALIKNEFDRRGAELLTAAKAEKLKLLDTDALAAQKRRVIEEKLQQDLVKLGLDRAEHEREIGERIAAIDEDIALRRIDRRRQQSSEFSLARAAADADEQAVRKQQLEEQYAADYFQQGQTEEQKLALTRQYLQAKEDLENEYADRSRERDKAGIAFGLEQVSGALQTVTDFQKISSDKELAKLDKDKKARQVKLEAEYKAGTISKEVYEAQKASIEADYDARTRAIKKEAAEKEKELNVAQAVIQTALSIVKASPNVPLMIAAGLTGAASVAKIIATPIPEFALGGIAGGPKPTWRERVREFATGGRINARAGVADVGQRHSSGGIRMVDGATGEHLGEWERGEAYMILSRDTYANNKHLVDELLDTSLYRGGASVRRQPGYFEDGGTFAPAPAASSAPATASAASQELVRAVNRVEDAVRALPSRQYIGWEANDTAELEQRLQERNEDRNQASIR